jgi:ABC-type transport system substrate-binding protein
MKNRFLAILVSTAMTASLLAGCGSASQSTTASGSTSGAASGTAASSSAAAATSIAAQNNNEQQVTASGDSAVKDSIKVESKDITSLDPWDTKADGKNALWEVYEMLFEVNGFGGEMFPMLADSSKGEFGGYDHVAGTGDYTVYLNDNITDSAGNKITASDVAFSFDSTFDAGQTSGWDAYKDGCVEVKDDTTCVFHFSRELDKMGELANIFARCFIVSQKAYEASPSKLVSDSCGTGPYKVTSYTAGSGVTIEARDDYWQTDASKLTQFQKANVKKIQYVVVTEPTQYVVGLENGDIEAVEDSMTANLLTDFQTGGSYADKFNVYQYKDNLSYYLAPNCSSKSVCGDVNMRLAVFYAIDTKGLLQALGGDAIGSVTNSLGSDVFPDYDKAWDTADNYQTVCDVDKAKEYLSKAGYSGQTLKLLIIQGDEDYAQIIQGMLQNAGIKCEISAYDYGTAQSTLGDETAWDLTIGEMAASDYLCNVWSHMFDTSNTKTGLTSTFIDDKDWQTMLDTTKVEATHTTENMDAWWNHAVENGYIMGLIDEYKNVVYPKDVTKLLFTDKNHVVFGGCTYSE